MAREYKWDFNYKDWLSDTNLHYCSWATRGMWIEILSRMCDSEETGKLHATPDQFCALLGCSREELFTALVQLYEHKVAEIDWPEDVQEIIAGYPQSYPTSFPDGVHTPKGITILTFKEELRLSLVRKLSEICHGPITIMNRRMYREYVKRRKDAERKQRQRIRERLEDDSRLFDVTGEVRDLSGSPKTAEQRLIEEVEGLDSNDNGEDTPARFGEDSIEYKLALLLRTTMLNNNQDAKVPAPNPKGLSKWSTIIDRTIRKDDRDPSDIADVITWAQDDEFWHTVILSPESLRKNFDKVFTKMRAEQGKAHERKRPRGYDSPTLRD